MNMDFVNLELWEHGLWEPRAVEYGLWKHDCRNMDFGNLELWEHGLWKYDCGNMDFGKLEMWENMDFGNMTVGTWTLET